MPLGIASNIVANTAQNPPYTDPCVRWCEGTDRELIPVFLLGSKEALILSPGTGF